MLLLVISALLVLAGASVWIVGQRFVGEEMGALSQILTVSGIIVLVIGLVLGVIALIRMNRPKKEKERKRANINRLVVTAMLIALGSALSLVKIWQMPLGGTVTLLSMLPIALISVEYGVLWGLSSSFVFSLIMMGLDLPAVLSWGLSPAAVIGTICLDYILAFTSIGLSGIFRKTGSVGVCLGVLLALVVRFTCHIISGTVIFDIWMPEGWASPLVYSLCYNGAFMLPETILTMIGTVILFKLPQFNRLVESNMDKKQKAPAPDTAEVKS